MNLVSYRCIMRISFYGVIVSFFYRVKAGSAGLMLMMADFRLSDREDEWREAPRTAVPGGAKETGTENVKKRER